MKDKEASAAASILGKKRWAGTTPEQRSAYCSRISKKITPEMAKVRTEKAVASRKYNKDKKEKTDYKWLPPPKPTSKRAPKKDSKFTGRRATIFTKTVTSDWVSVGNSLIDRHGKLSMPPKGLDPKHLEVVEGWIKEGTSKAEQTQGGVGIKLQIK